MTDGGPLGARALIVGAGIAGIAAAAAAAPFFESVVILDRDEIPDEARHRRGVAHGNQLHLLLKGGEGWLEQLMPGLGDALVAAGAVPVHQNRDVRLWERDAFHPSHDIGFAHLCMTRPAYERTMRRQLARFANIEIRDRRAATALRIEAGRIVGLDVADTGCASFERADLVVVATGRGGWLARQLVAAGLPDVPVTELGIDVNYASARFAKPARFANETRHIGCVPQPPDTRYGLVFPVENDEWVISLCGRFDRQAPTDAAGFLRYAADLPIPDVAERLRDAVRIEPVRAYRIATASYRHFDRYAALPQRLIPAGDTITSFNPTFGQGMSVAAGHAVALRDALRARQAGGHGLDGLAADYLPAANAHSAAAWGIAAGNDLEYPQTRGVRPADFARAVAWKEAFRRLAMREPDLLKLRFEIGNMTRPVTALRDDTIARQVMAELRRTN